MTDLELDSVLSTWDAPEPPASLRNRVLAGFPRRARRKILGVPLRWAIAFGVGAISIGLGMTALPYGYAIGRGEAGLGDGVYLRSTTLVQPPRAWVKYFTLGSASRYGAGWSQHYLYDRGSSTYFGYDFRVVPLGAQRYQVEVRPLSRTIDQISLTDLGDLRHVPLPELPPARIIGENDPFEVILAAHDDERVYDVIELSSTSFADDRPLKVSPHGMRLAVPKLYVNGTMLAEGRVDATGPTVWFYLPGQGRWLLSLSQGGNLNFHQAGHVNGKTIDLRLGTDDVRIECEQLAAIGGTRPVFVLYQPNFRINPKHPGASQPMFGSAGAPFFHYFTFGN